jgi:hypothetical protein
MCNEGNIKLHSSVWETVGRSYGITSSKLKMSLCQGVFNTGNDSVHNYKGNHVKLYQVRSLVVFSLTTITRASIATERVQMANEMGRATLALLGGTEGSESLKPADQPIRSQGRLLMERLNLWTVAERLRSCVYL